MEDDIIVKWAQEDVETSYNLLKKKKRGKSNFQRHDASDCDMCYEMNTEVVSNYKRMFVMPYVSKRCTTENRCNLTCETWPNSVTGTALNILHLSTRLSIAVGSTPRLCYQRGKCTRYPVNRGLGGPHNWSRSIGKQKYLLTMPLIKPYSLVIRPAARSLHRLICSVSAGYAHRCISKLPQIYGVALRQERARICCFISKTKQNEKQCRKYQNC